MAGPWVLNSSFLIGSLWNLVGTDRIPAGVQIEFREDLWLPIGEIASWKLTPRGACFQLACHHIGAWCAETANKCFHQPPQLSALNTEHSVLNTFSKDSNKKSHGLIPWLCSV